MPVASNQDAVNLSPPYEDIDLYASDLPLQDAVKANGGTAPAAILSAFGKHWGRATMFADAKAANENPPRLNGEVTEFDPAYHRFMTESMAEGVHTMTWQHDGSHAPPPSEVGRAARFYMSNQIEAGHNCPITMTRAAVAALNGEPKL
ncbi:MAG: DNA alkylation response protein, partial [Pseudolabrys sp.]|nr:DNA alkylation response protein [Pseudolabrys sp.]